MLSIFPNILFLAPFSAFFIRVALALILLFAANKHWTNAETTFKVLAVIEFATAISVGAGALAQAGALAGMFIIIYWFIRPVTRPISFVATFLSLVLCVSVLLTGAGPFAFDLPL